MKDENKIIECPNCKKKIRIPINKHIRLSCPDCNSKLEYKSGKIISVNGKKQIGFRRKFLVMGQKILIGAVITLGLNFILLKTGWNEWKKISEDINVLADKIISKAADMSPSSILFYITDTTVSINMPALNKTLVRPSKKVQFFWEYSADTLALRIKTFFSSYWYTKEGNAFWFGRILLILSGIISLLVSLEKSEATSNRSKALFLFPFNLLYWFGWMIVMIFVVVTLVYLILQALLLIGGGVVTLFTFLAASGGFLKLIADEIRDDVKETPKKRIMSYLLSLYPKRK